MGSQRVRRNWGTEHARGLSPGSSFFVLFYFVFWLPMSHCSSTICCKGCPSCIELLLHFIKKNQLDIFVWACLWVLYSIPLIYTFIPLKYHTILIIVKVKMLVAQSCLSLCDPMNCSLSGSSVYAILQAKILEWIAIPFSRGSSLPKDQTLISCIADRFFTIWATREAQSTENHPPYGKDTLPRPQQDLNLWPLVYKTSTLTPKLWSQVIYLFNIFNIWYL